jgi:DNA transformation protein
MVPRPAKLTVSPSFRAFVLDQLDGLGAIVARAMFGGVGLYHDGLFFGIIANDVLYLKADDVNRRAFAAQGARPFKPYPHRAGTMRYYSVPVEVLESPDDLLRWARQAVGAASRAAAGAITPTSRRR